MTSANALTPRQRLGFDTLMRRPTRGIGIFGFNPMEWRMIDRLAHMPEGFYQKNPVEGYRRMLVESGSHVLDQWIPDNPLTMTDQGYDAGTAHTATTGAESIVRDGIAIDSPEAVVRHMEEVEFPRIRKAIAAFDADTLVKELIARERAIQEEMGPDILKAPYSDVFARFPLLHYGMYGYEQYFIAYALYPEVIEKGMALSADHDTVYNKAAARAIVEGGFPLYQRIDHDMTDSRGSLVDIRSLDRMWFPHFSRTMQPFIEAGITLIWHCDGNVMQFVPRLLEIGFKGFQGFQYEDGVDYPAICAMKSRDGESLLIVGGVSVTTTLPHGTPDDVKREMKWLVDNGPKTGLFLGASSSIAPGVKWENLKVLVEGFRYYGEKGRGA